MKKNTLPVELLVGAVIVTYLCLCFCIPGFRIKLYATPAVYFLESLKSMALLKAIISLAVGIIVYASPMLIRKIAGK